MRDGHYMSVSTSNVPAMVKRVNEARANGYAPQGIPFTFSGEIHQILTKPDRPKNMGKIAKPNVNSFTRYYPDEC